MNTLIFLLVILVSSLLITSISFFLLVKSFIKSKISVIKEQIREWWMFSSEEEVFKRKIENFLANYPTTENKWGIKKDQKILKEIQSFFQKDFLEKKKISSELYQELTFMLEEKRKFLSFH